MNKVMVIVALVLCSACGTMYGGNTQSTLSREQSFQRSGSSFMVQEGSVTRSGARQFEHGGHYQRTSNLNNDPLALMPGLNGCETSLQPHDVHGNRQSNVRCF